MINNEIISVWFVTGVSQGLGMSICKRLLLDKRIRVVGLTRSPSSVSEMVEGSKGRMIALECNIRSEESVRRAVVTAIEVFGQIDVIVNNAGYIRLGSLEETSTEEMDDQIQVNLISSMHVIRAILPYMRERRSGMIFNMSSMIGFNCMFPGNAGYATTKAAMAGMLDSVRAEVEQFGIKTVIVYPGRFRTNLFGPDNYKVVRNTIPEYGTLDTEKLCLDNSGKQQGDPDKLSDILIKISRCENPPFHLFIGPDAIQSAEDRIKSIQRDIEAWKGICADTDF